MAIDILSTDTPTPDYLSCMIWAQCGVCAARSCCSCEFWVI